MAPRTTAVSLPTRFHADFDEVTRVRGWEYAEAGRVAFAGAGAAEVTATVRGTKPYAVAIVLGRRGVHASCSCPAYARGSFCKHLWATLLVAERRGHLQELLASKLELLHDASRPARREVPGHDDAGAGGDDDGGDDDGDGAGAGAAAARVAAAGDAGVAAGRRAGTALGPGAGGDDGGDDDDLDDDEEFDALGNPLPRLAAAGQSTIPRLPYPEELRRHGWRRLVGQVARRSQAPTPSPGPASAGPRLAGRGLQYALDVAAARDRDRVELSLVDRWRRKDGALTAPRAVRVRLADLPLLADPEDRRLVGLLIGAPDAVTNGYGYPYSYYQGTSSFALHEPYVASLLPDVCRTGRLFLCRGAGDVDAEPCAWDDAPYTLRVRLEERPAGYAFVGYLERDGGDDARVPLRDVTLLLRGGVVLHRRRAARFDFAGDFEWIVLLREHGEVPVPRDEVDELLEALYATGTAAGVELPPALRPAEVPGTPRPAVRLTRAPAPWGGTRGAGRLTAVLAFAYEGVEVARGDPRPAIFDRAGRRLVTRDRVAEGAARDLLLAVGFQPAKRAREPGGADLELAAVKLPRVVPELLAAGFHVEAEAAVFRAAGAVRLSVTSGIDWFDVDGGVAFGDEVVPLPRLLKAARAGERFVTLGDGALGVLPAAWLERVGLLLRAGATHETALRFRRSQTLLIDALLAAEGEVEADAEFTALRARLRDFDGIALRSPPPTFCGQLRPYQQAGLGWLHFLRDHGLGGCLADDMGLGKTVQVLAFLESRRSQRERPSLVVAPRSVLFNWQAEAERFTPRLRVAVHDGADRTRAGLDFGAADLVLTTYGILRRDAAALAGVRFDCVILDEAQTIKNAASATAKAARLLKGEQRLALSGTPIENHLGELWSLMEFLNPGMLGSASVFRTALGEGAARDPAGRDLLARALKPMLLRRTKGDVAPELPERLEQVVAVDLEPPERARYDELRAHYQQTLLGRDGRDLGKGRFHVLEALLRLRQAACHGGLLDPRLAAGPSAKLDLLRERLREVVDEGHKALVFSQFTSFLALVRAALDRDGIVYEYLDGKTRDRAARVARFQGDPDCPVFLISLKAGGLGLNLTAAEYVFLLDPWWNPAVEAQAIDRTHRIGQQRSVFAYRLVARDTVEEKVLALQQTKRDLADAILRADRSLLQDLTREDLQLLLS